MVKVVLFLQIYILDDNLINGYMFILCSCTSINRLLMKKAIGVEGDDPRMLKDFRSKQKELLEGDFMSDRMG